MTDHQMASGDELVAEYVRAAMRVEPPITFTAEVMRSVTAVPQERRGWVSWFGPYTPAIAAMAAAALIIAIGLLVASPRNVGPPTGASAEPTATPAPTLTPEDARILTEPGDEIRIPALDSEGQFGTIHIRRGEDKSGYDGFVPFAFEDVFFVELYIKYEPDRLTDEQYGEWEFAFAVDLEGDGFDGEELQRGVGFLGMEGQPGYESAPQPIMQGKRFGDDVLEGWLVLEVPAAAASYPLHLVYGHGEWTDGIQNMIPDASALLRDPGEPIGVTAFDPDYIPPGAGTPMPMPSFHVLPTPMPSPAATFEPLADADADALFVETQSCDNAGMGLTIRYPGAWHTNATYEDLAACSMFGPDPIDSELIYNRLGDFPPIYFMERDSWQGGIEQPSIERLPIGDRIAWRITYSEDQLSTGTTYLLPLDDDAYGRLLSATAGRDEARAVLERMLLLVEVTE